MMKLSFRFPISSARPSQGRRTTRSVFSFGPWFFRAGRVSAMAACLMATAPPTIFAQSPMPTASVSTPSQEGFKSLLESLQSEDPTVRKTAVEKLAWWDDPRPAVEPVRKMLKDTDPIVRATAARAIWQIEETADESVPILVELLKSQNNNHRELAAYFLGPMADAARPAIPALRKAMSDPSVSLQIHAAEALAQIDPQGTEAVDVLIKAMKHADPAARSLAAMAFSNVDPSHAERVVPVLRAAVVDADPGVRTSAELALPTFNLDVSHSGQHPLREAADANALEAKVVKEDSLVPTAENTSPFVALTEQGEQALQAVAEDPLSELPPELAQAVRDLAHADPAFRRSALDRIAWMGPAAEAVIPEVTLCLTDPHPGIQAYAAKTLWDLDKQSGLASITTLRELLDSTQPGIRPLAAFYLGYIGPDAAPTLPVLKRALANTEYTEQLQIAEAVARINPEDTDAVNVLIGGLRDPEAGVRFQAAYALSEVSPVHGPTVVPELATASKDQNPQVRQAAELALANFPAPAVQEEIAVAKAEVPSAKIPKAEFEEVSAVEVETNKPTLPILDSPFEPAASPESARGTTSQVALLDPEPIAPHPVVPVETRGEYELIPTPTEEEHGPPPRLNRLGLGDDYKPITAINISITPKRRDADGDLLALPTNYGAAWLHTLERYDHPRGLSRPWALQAKQYAATGFCHRPLYFEEVNLERYGHNFGCVIQPFVSAGAFFGRVPLLPYMMAADHPWECQYTLGHYRPGNCVPFQHMHLPWSTSGTLLESAIITGLFFAIY